MPSFEMHFGTNGEVLVNNIKGIAPGDSECLNLTSPYEQSLGVPIVRQSIASFEQVDINIQSGENA